MEQDTASRRLIDDTLIFFSSTLGASGAMFYWITPELDTQNDRIIDVPARMVARYQSEMAPHDPLLTARLVRRHKSVGCLETESRSMPAASTVKYRRFLSEYAVTDNLDFIFRDDATDRAYAGISLIQRSGAPDLPQDEVWLEGLRLFAERTLRHHEKPRAERLDTALGAAGLTVREREVARLMARGAANADIGYLMQLRPTTVKAYAQSIFDKLGVGCRAALAARIADLQYN